MNRLMPDVPLILAGAASKAADAESVITKAYNLLWWSIWAKGFAACAAMVVLMLVFGAAFAVVMWFLIRTVAADQE